MQCCILLNVAGAMHSVLIKGDVLISKCVDPYREIPLYIHPSLTKIRVNGVALSDGLHYPSGDISLIKSYLGHYFYLEGGRDDLVDNVASRFHLIFAPTFVKEGCMYVLTSILLFNDSYLKVTSIRLVVTNFSDFHGPLTQSWLGYRF